MQEKTNQENNKGNVSYVELRELNMPEPVETKTRKGWVQWGDNNLYPQFLNYLALQSPTHAGILEGKIRYIYGKGVDFTGDKNVLTNGTSESDLNEIVEGCIENFETFEAFALLIKKDIYGAWVFELLDVEKCRVSEDDDTIFYSDDWSTNRQSYDKTGYKEYTNILSKEFKPETDGEAVFFYRKKTKQSFDPNNPHNGLIGNYYTNPNYSGAIVAIMCEIEMNFFQLSEAINGYKGGTIISLNNGVPKTETERRDIENQIKDTATNRNKQGGITIIYSNGKDKEPTVNQVNGNDLPQRYLVALDSVRDTIMISHGVVSPDLFAVKTEGQLGGLEEKRVSFEVFKSNYIEPRQKLILDAFNWLIKKLDLGNGDLFFVDYLPKFLEPVNENKPESIPQEFKDDPILKALSKCGKKRTECKILKSRGVNDFDKLEDSEQKFMLQFREHKFQVSTLQNTILQMIASGEDFTSIVKATGEKPSVIAREIMKLEKDGYLSKNNVTEKGQVAIIDSKKIEVRYSYELRPNVPEAKSGSRAFCKALISLDRLYTRQEIDAISAKEDRNVWLYRGGWYLNPKTKVATPFCRHEWRQNIVTI